MRQINDKNQIWFEKQDQVTRIGFTRDFLQSLDQCWHILPANLEKFREKSPLLSIETNDALISIVSPVKGNFMEFSHKAQNFPNKLTENDVVLSLTEAQVQRQQPWNEAVLAQPQVAVRPGNPFRPFADGGDIAAADDVAIRIEEARIRIEQQQQAIRARQDIAGIVRAGNAAAPRRNNRG